MRVSKNWYSDDTLPEDIPPTIFELAESWNKPSLEKDDKVLIQELIFIANILVRNRH